MNEKGEIVGWNFLLTKTNIKNWFCGKKKCYQLFM